MSDYRTDYERFRREQEQAERDGKHLDNLRILSQHCHVPVHEVMDFIRPKVKLKKIIRLEPARRLQFSVPVAPPRIQPFTLFASVRTPRRRSSCWSAVTSVRP